MANTYLNFKDDTIAFEAFVKFFFNAMVCTTKDHRKTAWQEALELDRLCWLKNVINSA